MNLAGVVPGTIAALALGLLPLGLAAQTVGGIQWSHVPAIQGDSKMGDLLVDLDGDGRNEVVRVAADYGSDVALWVMEFAADGGLTVVGLATFNEFRDIAAVAVVPRTGRPDSLLVSGNTQPFRIGQIELEGKDLRRVRTLSSLSDIRIVQVADIDADGDVEMVGIDGDFGPGEIRIANYATGMLERSSLLRTPWLQAAQLDADPALELILESEASYSPGRVMDGATGLVEWQTPDSFAYGINAGRLTSNLAMPAFVATDANLTRVFSGSPYALVNELPLRMILSQSAVLDFDGNGSDELYALVAGVGLGRFDPLSGQTNVFAPTRSGDRAPNVGRLSAGGTSLALVTAANDARGGFRVVDIGTGATVHDQTNERGPFTSAAYFDPDGSGTMRVALLSEVNRSALPQFALTVIDAETGQVVGRQLLPSVEGFINGPVRLSGGNFDGAPGDELAVTGVAGGTVVFHGATLGEFWRKDEPEFIEVSAAVAAPDLDGDGRAELIQVYEPLGSSRGIRALHGESGEILWDSGPASLALQEELRVGDYDGTVGLELLLTGPNVRAFDVATGAFKWELAPVGMPQPFYRYTAWGAGTPACRIGMLLGDYFAGSNRMQTFRCADLSPEAVHWIPEGTRSVAALDSDGVVWAISAAGTVWLGGPGLPSTPLSLPQEMTLVQARPGNAMRQGPGHIDLLLGSNLRLVTFRVAGDGLFANRFEAP